MPFGYPSRPDKLESLEEVLGPHKLKLMGHAQLAQLVEEGLGVVLVWSVPDFTHMFGIDLVDSAEGQDDDADVVVREYLVKVLTRVGL